MTKKIKKLPLNERKHEKDKPATDEPY